MQCSKCGGSATELEDFKVGRLQFDSEGRIDGIVSVKTACPMCGVSDSSLAIEIEVQVPRAHRQSDHELIVDFDVTLGSSKTRGFPVTIRCSCGAFKTESSLVLRRPN